MPERKPAAIASLAAVSPEDAELDAAYETLRVALLVYRDAQNRFERAMLAVEQASAVDA